MRPFAERREARVERLRASAKKAAAGSDAAFSSARRLGDAIPFGQPILVGHHSERRARRDAERIHANMSKGVELSKQAEDLSRRADAAEENIAISSDDPEAVWLLREKLAAEVAFHARWTAINKALRIKSDAAKLDALKALALTPRELTTLKHAACGTGFVTTNATANIRRIKTRIAELELRAARPAAEEVVLGDVTIDEQDNRTRIHFPGKPAASVISDLKINGFR